jgi:SPP1 gp7 family putative phage head morphogenesis protein
MSLRAALRERALVGHAFGHRPRLVRSRTPQIRPARFPHAAHMAYLRGLLEFVSAIGDAMKRHIVPELPRLVAAHARTQPVLDAADAKLRRIAIVGVPRAGKTTAANRLGELLGLQVHSSDDLIALGWSEASAATAELIAASSARGGIFEGVAVVRALRKLLEASRDGQGLPVDDVLVLNEPHETLTPGQRAMAEGVKTIARAVLPRLAARGARIVYAAGDLIEHAPSVTPRTDEADDDVSQLFGRVENDVDQSVRDVNIGLLAQQNALRVSEHAKNELSAQVRQVLAIDLNAPDTGVPQHVRNFVAQQITLIKGLKAQTLAKTHSVVLEGIRQGLRSEEIAKQLQEQVKLSKTRATIIANDQIGKLHGELTRMRQTALGIKRYRWATSRDELVRPGHRALEGTTQSWSEPPVVNAKTGKRAHPGMDTHFYPCRCSAIPIIDDLLEEAGLQTLPPPPDPANTNQPANQNAKPKRARAAPAPALPPEQTPAHWEPQFRAEYKDAAPQVAWGHAMRWRGLALSLEDFQAGASELRKRGVEIADFNQFGYFRGFLEEGKPRTVADLLSLLESDPDMSNTRRAVAREVRLASQLVAHRRALVHDKRVARIVLKNPIAQTTRNVTRKQVEAARTRARRIYETLSSKTLEQPVDYDWIANHKDRGFEDMPAGGKGVINFGASRTNLSDDDLVRVTLHEWGHSLERLNDKRLKAAVDFLDARAGTEQPRKLNDLLHSDRYEADEIAIKDRLHDPYMGKEYRSTNPSQRTVRERYATEVTAMAVQDVYDVTRLAANMADTDPEAFDWMLGQLADQ